MDTAGLLPHLGGAQQMAAIIAHLADLGTLGTAEHKYWKTLGQKLLAPLLFAAARDDRTMTEVLRWVDLREDNEVAKLLEAAGVDGAITAWEASQSGLPQCPPVAYARSGSPRSWPSTPGSLGPRGPRRPSSGVGPVAAKRLSCSVPGSPAPPGMRTPSPPSTGSPPSPAGLSRPASKPASNAPPGGLNRPAPTSWPPAPTSGCWPAKPANRPGGDPIARDPTVTQGA